MESILRVLERYRQNKKVDKSEGFLRLFISKRLIQGAAAAIVVTFGPIFIYITFGEFFFLVGLYYATLSFLYLLLLAPGMRFTNRIGFSRSLVVSGFFCVCIYSLMFFLTPENTLYLVAPLTLSVVFYWIFHWVPYHVDFTLFTKDGERGKQVGLSFAAIAFMGVIGPILAGFIILHADYEALFGTAVVLMIVATISYAFVPETTSRFEWSIKETWKNLFSRDLRGVVVGEFAAGAEIVVSLVVWPIFLYEILDGNVFEIGAVSTIVVGATIILQLVLGKYLDEKRRSKERVLKVGSTLYALGWIFKIFVLSAAQVFFVGLYHNVVKVFTKTPFNTILYDMSADQGKYVDEFTVIRQMSNHSGRVVSLLVIAVLTIIIPISWTFIIAAAASIALNLVYRVKVND